VMLARASVHMPYISGRGTPELRALFAEGGFASSVEDNRALQTRDLLAFSCIWGGTLS
jgi:hypothetical protein